MTALEKTKLIEKNKGKSLKDLNPDLAREWHPTKNGDLTPEMVAVGSHKKVWWIFPYDVRETGQHFDFEWEAEIKSRYQGNGCPFLSGKAVYQGFNDLATSNPILAKEWHPTKNGDLTPERVTCNSHKKVWWYLPYDDPKTGKHFDFEWEASILGRAYNNAQCPFLSGSAIYPGFNDLATTHPSLAKEWHPTKNGDLTPSMVFAGSLMKVWWYLPYDDPETGKHFVFEWESNILGRKKGNGCPFLSGRAVWAGFNDLATVNPELASEWHTTKNKKLTPQMVTINSHKKVWWLMRYNDPLTGKYFDFEWESTVANRNSDNRCPFIVGKAVYRGFNDFATLKPELAKEWHPFKNGSLTPKAVTINSGKMVWWRCNNGHEWEAVVQSRSAGCGCPHCNVSRGEARISRFCKKYSIESREQYKFDDCFYKRKLPFDRAIFNKNGELTFLVEYDGEQHFKPIDFAGKNSGKKEFETIKIRDNIKNEYCRKNRIPLVRISYKDYDNIEKILLKKMVRYGLM